jgi:DNA repair exonuclease SbcCD nuclease subunit
MKILLFSDIHLAQWNYGSRLDSDGLTSRFKAQLDVLRQVLISAITNEVECVVFGGDFFHTFNDVDARVLYEVSAHLRMWGNIDLHFLVGNHDQSSNSGRHNSLGWLRGMNRFKVHDLPLSPVGDYEVPLIFGPHTYDRDQLRRTIDFAPADSILILHQGIQGVPINSDFVLPNEILRAEDIPDRVMHTFCGHYHGHTRVTDRTTIIGATNQHTRADVGQQRGWIIYNTDNNEITRFESVAPKFLRVREQDLDSIDPENNMIQVISDDPSGKLDGRIMDRLRDGGAGAVEVDHPALENPCLNPTEDMTILSLFKQYSLNMDDADRLRVGEGLVEGTYAPPVH